MVGIPFFFSSGLSSIQNLASLAGMFTRRGFAGPIVAERVHFGPNRHKLLKIEWKEKTKLRHPWPTWQLILCKPLILLWRRGGIRTRSAIILPTTCRFYVAGVAIDAMVAMAAWPILAHGPDSDTSVLFRCRGVHSAHVFAMSSSLPAVLLIDSVIAHAVARDERIVRRRWATNQMYAGA